MRILSMLVFIFTAYNNYAQIINLLDTVRRLDEIKIEAYAYQRSLQEVPAAVAYLKSTDIQRFNNSSLLPAMNTIPGVRMEQRSPGSYRLSIRGSTLRSPFGVRNVKVYWGGLPFTDAGGNTFINLIDAESVQNLEVIKGPGSSLYGAGTGGVLLLNPFRQKGTSLNAGILQGSYGLLRARAGLNVELGDTQLSLQANYQTADGYRDQTEMIRANVSLFGKSEINDVSTLEYFLLYTDLAYQIPGGLTLAESIENPRQARPAAGPNPGAVEQQAALYNRTAFAGINHTYRFSDRVINRTGLYGSITDFENPVIRNYEIKTENNFGGRTDTGIQLGKNRTSTLHIGTEFQYGFTPTTTYQNNFGVIGDVLEDDEINQLQYFFFSQVEKEFSGGWLLTIGGSLNYLRSSFIRLNELDPQKETANFDPVISPRLALLKRLHANHNVYAQLSRGFSPPTIAELRPSEGTFNRNLEAEQGWNYELGFKGNLIQSKLYYELIAYRFILDQSIVIRRTLDGAEYFENAGGTKQNGIELLLNWRPFAQGTSLVNSRFWHALSWQHYRFRDYIKVDNDFSGNKLTGSPEWMYTLGADLQGQWGHYLNLTMQYVSAIPLDDANINYTDAYVLLGLRAGVRMDNWDLFIGADNLLDTQYTAGPDLNAFGQRFYNPSMGRNFYFGINAKLGLKKAKPIVK
jgi:iron complex outermembrane recepter protein